MIENCKLIDVFENNMSKLRDMLCLNSISQEAEYRIHDLCLGFKSKLILILYLRDITTNVDWDLFRYFEAARADRQQRKDPRCVFPSMEISFKNRDTMENFIVSNLMNIFSLILSVTGMLGKLINLSFDLKIRDEEASIFVVHRRLPNCPLKDLLERKIAEDKWLYDVRAIRNECEHADHTQVFNWPEEKQGKPASLGNIPWGIPIINPRFFRTPPDIQQREINNYINFVFTKLDNLVKSLLETLCVQE